MKVNVKTSILFSALMLIFSAAAFGQQQPPVSGGYSSQPTDDSSVQTAARFAVTSRAEAEHLEIRLVRVAKAQAQVVAGRNFRLCLVVKIADEGQSIDDAEEVFIDTLVYRDLQDNYSLKSWEEKDCR